MKVVVNGRFTGQPVTGVQRYAREILARLDLPVEIIAPRHASRGLQGHLWEQSILPPKTGDAVLWSPCGCGPLLARNLVMTIHDAASLDHPEWFGQRFALSQQVMVPLLMRRARRVITVSEFSKRRLLARVKIPADRVIVIPNGVGEQFHPVPRDRGEQMRSRLQLDRPYLLAVGSLEPRKNLVRLLQAWELLALDRQGLELVVVGSQAPAFRSCGLTRIPNGVRFLGAVPDLELPALYSTAELFIYPSVYEGFGLPPLEAMACGAPVVSSTAGALVEALGDAPVYVDPLSPESMANGVAKVLGDADRCAELRRRGIERSRRLTWDESARRTADVLRRVWESRN